MIWKMKNWLLRLTEPWREEQAVLDLEWKTFAKKHNAAGHRPPYWHPGVELDPMDKVSFVDAREVDPNYLRDQHAKGAKDRNLRFSNRKGMVETDG